MCVYVISLSYLLAFFDSSDKPQEVDDGRDTKSGSQSLK